MNFKIKKKSIEISITSDGDNKIYEDIKSYKDIQDYGLEEIYDELNN